MRQNGLNQSEYGIFSNLRNVHEIKVKNFLQRIMVNPCGGDFHGEDAVKR